MSSKNIMVGLVVLAAIGAAVYFAMQSDARGAAIVAAKLPGTATPETVATTQSTIAAYVRR